VAWLIATCLTPCWRKKFFISCCTFGHGRLLGPGSLLWGRRKQPPCHEQHHQYDQYTKNDPEPARYGLDVGICRCCSRNGSNYPPGCGPDENADIGNDVGQTDGVGHHLALRLAGQIEGGTAIVW